MKVLYFLPETAETKGGGIATYLHHAKYSLANEGHTFCILTWSIKADGASETREINDSFREVKLSAQEISRNFPNAPWSSAVSFSLVSHLLDAIADWGPDVLETCDYMGPGEGYLTQRRAGLLSKSQDLPVVTYNHGLHRDIWRAGALLPDHHVRQEIAAERNAVRWSDKVLVPSQHASVVLRKQTGELNNMFCLPEPFFWPQNWKPSEAFASRFVHAGRISVAKGIDVAIHFMNLISTLTSVDEIVLIGKVVDTPFRTKLMNEYVVNRLVPDLRSKIQIEGPISREIFEEKIRGNGVAGYSLNFSRSETFNYVFLEQLAFGMAPFAQSGSAMAEFYPRELSHLLLPQSFDLKDVTNSWKLLNSTISETTKQIGEFAAQLTAPARFAREYERLVSDIMPNRRTRTRRVKRVSTEVKPSNVTFLVPTYNPTEQIFETLDSLDDQTVKGFTTVVYDDGSTTPSSIRLIEQLKQRPEVKVIQAPVNTGLCSVRNKLIDACETEFAVFLDDDDLLLPTFLEQVLLIANNNTIEADAVVPWRRNFGENDHLALNHNFDDYEHFISNNLRMTALIKTSVLKNLRFDTSMRNGEADDWDFWLRFEQRGFVAAILPEALFLYRARLGSMSWPWTIGQAANTVSVISSRAIEEIRKGNLPEHFILDLYSRAVLAEFKVEKLSAQKINLHNRSTKLESRLKKLKVYEDMNRAKHQHPFIGGGLKSISKAIAKFSRLLFK